MTPTGKANQSLTLFDEVYMCIRTYLLHTYVDTVPTSLHYQMDLVPWPGLINSHCTCNMSCAKILLYLLVPVSSSGALPFGRVMAKTSYIEANGNGLG
jgi:hypothetical protein